MMFQIGALVFHDASSVAVWRTTVTVFTFNVFGLFENTPVGEIIFRDILFWDF